MSNREPNEPKPAYFAIIPARVRYAPELPPNAKLLYGEITALCNEKGYCWAGNEYFADLYRVKRNTISDWISILVKNNFLAREIIYKSGTKEIDKRVLRLTEALPLYDKNRIGYPVNSDDPIRKKPKENNTMNSVFITEVINRDYEKYKNFLSLILDWVEYKKTEKKQSYKTEKGLKAFINRLIKISSGNIEKAKEIVETSMANNWSGIFAPNSKPKDNEKRNSGGFTSGSQLYGGQ